MKTGVLGLALIKHFEGLRLSAYDDGVGIWTVGYGHTAGVKRGQTITEAEAEAFLRDDLAGAEAAVTKLAKTPLNQNEFDALVSFVFNCGAAAFAGSTLLRQLNGGDKSAVPEELARWNHAAGRVMAGLTKRRAAEAALWSTPVAQMEQSPPSSLEGRVAALEAWRATFEMRAGS
jgi:lysozyme